jgi:hypothetical protein
LIWGGYDVALDAIQTEPPLPLEILDIIAPFILQIFEWPSGIPFADIPLDTTAQKWSFGNWVVGWAPIPLNVAILLIGTLPDSDPATSAIARYSDPVGKGVLTGLGCLNLVVGAVASDVAKLDTWGVIANTMSPFSNLFQFLRIQAVEDESDGVSPAIKLLIDDFTSSATSIALFMEASQVSGGFAPALV